jgi:hypothetical protein
MIKFITIQLPCQLLRQAWHIINHVAAPYSFLYDDLKTSYDILHYHNIYDEYRFVTNIYVTPRVIETLIKVINKWLGAVTSLNQKTKFKNKVSDSNYREIDPNFLFEWNSKFWSSLMKIDFFLAIRCNKDHASQIS